MDCLEEMGNPLLFQTRLKKPLLFGVQELCRWSSKVPSAPLVLWNGEAKPSPKSDAEGDSARP